MIFVKHIQKGGDLPGNPVLAAEFEPRFVMAGTVMWQTANGSVPCCRICALVSNGGSGDVAVCWRTRVMLSNLVFDIRHRSAWSFTDWGITGFAVRRRCQCRLGLMIGSLEISAGLTREAAFGREEESEPGSGRGLLGRERKKKETRIFGEEEYIRGGFIMKYLMIITAEDERYMRGEVQLDFFSSHPWEGLFVDVVKGNTFEELYGDGNYEGLFYQLYETDTGHRIGCGIFDPDAPKEEIREWETKV